MIEIVNELGNTAPLKENIKVKCISDYENNWGNCDPIKDNLEVGNTYIVAKVEVHSWHTKVWLKEVSGKVFNSVHFQEVEVYQNVKICSITPYDNYNLSGKNGKLLRESLTIGSAMIMEFSNDGNLRTSKIESIKEDESTIEVKTRNSVYILSIVKEVRPNV